MKRQIQWAKLFTMLTCGLVLFGGWGYINYSHYEEVQQSVIVQVEQNSDFIDNTVLDIEVEQKVLRQTQEVNRVYQNQSPVSYMMAAPEQSIEVNIGLGGSITSTFTDPPPPPVTTVTPLATNAQLQAKIDRLEAEKNGYLNDKGTLTKEIEDVMSILKLDTKNPLINFVILPLIGYMGKRTLDMIFKRIEERFSNEV
jgi:hypothetical protein